MSHGGPKSEREAMARRDDFSEGYIAAVEFLLDQRPL
jgi:hypothetical protein